MLCVWTNVWMWRGVALGHAQNEAARLRASPYGLRRANSWVKSCRDLFYPRIYTKSTPASPTNAKLWCQFPLPSSALNHPTVIWVSRSIDFARPATHVLEYDCNDSDRERMHSDAKQNGSTRVARMPEAWPRNPGAPPEGECTFVADL